MVPDIAACHITVVLPAYNEASGIAALISDICSVLDRLTSRFQVIVVEDGSSDNTAEVLSGLRQRLPIAIRRHPHNEGLGRTVRDGLLAAIASVPPDEEAVLITMDADRTHPPDLIPDMVRSVNLGYDVVIASRYEPTSELFGVPLHRQIASFLTSRLFQWLCPIPGARDYTSGYRAYRLSTLRQLIAAWGPSVIESTSFACMAELLLKINEIGATFTEVPLSLRYDLKRGRSKMAIWPTLCQTVKVAAEYRLNSVRALCNHLPSGNQPGRLRIL